MSNGNSEVKIRFTLPPSDDLRIKSEDLWAESLSSGFYRIANVPFLVYGISINDLVSAEFVNGVLEFRGISARGGHSTYRIFAERDREIGSPEFEKYWQPISTLGAVLERGNKRLAAVDIPPSADVRKIYALLERGEEAGVWKFEEGDDQSS